MTRSAQRQNILRNIYLYGKVMNNNYFEEQIYEGINYTADGLPGGSYEICTFVNCDLSNCDLGGIKFTECEFKSCNLSMVKVIKTSLNDIQFRDCKLLGINFENCDTFLFSVAFDNCTLNYSSFYKRLLKKTRFANCIMQEVDFTDSDLNQSVFDNCDLAKAKFENTNLEKVDFRTAYNYALDPEINRVKKAQFSLPGVVGLLSKYDIVIK